MRYLTITNRKIFSVIFPILLLFVCLGIWGLFLFGGSLHEEQIDAPKFIKNSSNQFYYIKAASWVRTLFFGGISDPSQVHLYENEREIPSGVEVIWSDSNQLNHINQVIVTFTTPDKSDPRDNGKSYRLLWQWKPGIVPLILSLVLFLIITNWMIIVMFKDRFHLTENPVVLLREQNLVCAILIFLINFFLIALVLIIISLITQNHIDQNIIDSQIFPAYRFKPEQIERSQYITGLFLFPLISCVFWYLFEYFVKLENRTILALCPLLSLEMTLLISIILFFSVINNHSFYIRNMSFFNYPGLVIGAFIVFVLLIYLESIDQNRWIIRFLTVKSVVSLILVFVYTFFVTLMTKFDPYVYSLSPHFSAYVYSIDQVFKGKTLLVDFTNQYGFYPYFLEPVFKVIGIGAIQITIVMACLQVFFFAIILFILFRNIKSRVIFLCAIWLIPGTYLWSICCLGNNESYYQYWPHRVLFPGLILLGIWLYQTSIGKTKQIIHYFAFFICGCALLWNFDTGLIVLICWTLFLCWQAVEKSPSRGLIKTALIMLSHIIKSIVTYFAAIALLYIYTFLRSGSVPDLGKYFYYQSIFYGAGFYMLPIPGVIHMWLLIILVYAVGIYIGISRMGHLLFNQTQETELGLSPRTNIIFISSIMGVGLFSYYQGRSHDANLLAVSWIFWFLLVFYLDDLYQALINQQTRAGWSLINLRLGSSYWAILLAFIISSYTTAIIGITPQLSERVKNNFDNLVQLSQGGDNQRDVDIALINRYYKRGENVLILGIADQAYLYIQSGTINPLPVPSFSEIFSKQDFQIITDYIACNQNMPIIMSNHFSGDFPSLFEQVRKRYIIIDQTENIAIYSPEKKK